MSVRERGKYERHCARTEATRQNTPTVIDAAVQERARRSGEAINGAESGQVIQQSQATFEATLTTRTTVSIDKWTPLRLNPPLQELEPNAGDYLEGNAEERMYEYLFTTIRNIAIDQGDAICKNTMGTGKCIHASQRPLYKHCIAVRNVRVHSGEVIGSTRGRGYATPGTKQAML